MDDFVVIDKPGDKKGEKVAEVKHKSDENDF